MGYDSQRMESDSAIPFISNVFTATSVVTFVDVTQPPNTRLVSTSDSLYSLRSMVDFFYPFVQAIESL